MQRTKSKTTHLVKDLLLSHIITIKPAKLLLLNVPSIGLIPKTGEKPLLRREKGLIPRIRLMRIRFDFALNKKKMRMFGAWWNYALTIIILWTPTLSNSKSIRAAIQILIKLFLMLWVFEKPVLSISKPSKFFSPTMWDFRPKILESG